MTLSKKLIENVECLKKSLNEISVYDLDVYTSMELYYKIAKKLNEVITELMRFEGLVSDEVVKQNEKLIYLLGEGLNIEVVKKINEMIADGTMDTIINHNVFTSLNNKIDEFKSDLDSQIKDIEIKKLDKNDFDNNIFNLDLNIEYNYCRILSGLDVQYENGFKKIYEGKYILNNKYYDYSNKNPKLLQTVFSTNSSVKDSFILKDGNIYYMFYTSFAESDGDIGVATSSDLENWDDKGIIIRKNQATWSENLPIWAPWVSKKQSDGYYYMFVSGASPYRSCIFKSTSLLTGWQYVDYVKNSNGSIIAGIDVDINYIDGKYVMLISNNENTPSIEMYYSDKLTSNNWVFVKNVITKSESWEGSVVEAGQIVKINKNQYAIFYGGNGSQSSQHIGLAISNSLFGDYKKVGLNGMILLDLPMNYKSIIAHPNIYYNENNNLFYIYCTVANSNNKNEIICYTTSNFKDISPLKFSENLEGINSGMLYINPYNDLIISNLSPNTLNAEVAFDKELRKGIIVLGYFSSSGYTRFRVYENKLTIIAKSDKLNLVNDAETIQTSFINAKIPTDDIATQGTLVAKLSLSYKNSVSSGFNINVLKNGTKIPIFTKDVINMGVSSWLSLNTSWEKWTSSSLDDICISSKRNSADGYYSLGENTTLNFAIEY